MVAHSTNAPPEVRDVDWPAAESRLAKISVDNLIARHSGPIDKDLARELAAIGVSVPHREAPPSAVLTSEERRLRELQTHDAREGARARGRLHRKLRKLDATGKRVLDSAANPARPVPVCTVQRALTAIQQKRAEARDEFLHAISGSPEAFIAAHSAELRAYRRQYEGGRIIETPYVREKLSELREKLQARDNIFVSGETGIGKTEVSRIAARRFSGKEPVVVRGYLGMGSDELFGRMVLTDNEDRRAEALAGEVDRGLRLLRERIPHPSADQEANTIAQILSRGNVTSTEYLMGGVYRAAREGRVVIIDEANLIPPEFLAKLNDIMTKRPGERIDIQEDGSRGIEVREGFGIIFTGNENPPSGPRARRYIGRASDLPFLDRVSKVSYSYLPQAVDGQPRDFSLEEKQLFLVALVTALLPPGGDVRTSDEKLEDRLGSCFLPGGARGLDLLWRLSQFAAVTQRAFAGEIRDGDTYGFSLNGISTGIETSVSLSPRSFMRVIESWKASGFQVELDHFVAEDLISRAQDPRERAYLYQLGQFFGLFEGDGWEKAPNFQDAVERGIFNPAIPRNPAEPGEVVPARDVIMALVGEIPARTVWPNATEGLKIERQREVADAIARGVRFERLAKDVEELTSFLGDD